MQIKFEINREELHVICIFYVSVYKTPLTLATLTLKLGAQVIAWLLCVEPSPVKKHFFFQGTITVGLEIWDKDRISKDDYVEGVHASVPSVLPGPYHNPFRRALTLTGTRVTVKLDVELYCDKNYYGAACNVKCISRDDDSRGHYTCDRHGRKICKSNWFGSSCTRKCVPRDDPRSGHFSCDDEGNRRCLRNWQGPSCKSCVKNWYGPRCSTHCAPMASDRLGHYK